MGLPLFRARVARLAACAHQANGMSFVVKLNDQAQRAVLCKDPFRSVDERVEKLIAGM